MPFPECLTLSPRFMKEIQEIGSDSPSIKEIRAEGSAAKSSIMNPRLCLVLWNLELNITGIWSLKFPFEFSELGSHTFSASQLGSGLFSL